MSQNIYYEKQRNGLCRLHSLNAFFGSQKISDSDFEVYKNEYDIFMKKKFNTDIMCNDYDYINSDQNTIISYILKYKYNIFTRYYYINELHNNKWNSNKTIENIINDINGKIINNFIFVFNQNHICGIKNINNKWFRIDSINGIKEENIHNLSNEKNIGYIIPINSKFEFHRNIDIIWNIINKYDSTITYSIMDLNNKKNNINKIGQYLKILHVQKLVLDDIEIPLTIIMEIFEINLNKKNDDSQIIKNMVENYNYFLKHFTNKNYNNIDLILEYLPNIIYQILRIKK
jgi:hypothetical protein